MTDINTKKEKDETVLSKTDEHKTDAEIIKEIKKDGRLSENETEEMKAIMKQRLLDISEGISLFDIDPYIGIRTTISKVVIEDGVYGKMLRAETLPLGTYEIDDGEKTVSGSVIFPVYEEDGIIKYRPKSKLGKFMFRHKLKSPADLIGCSVMTTIRSTYKGDFISFA